MGVRILHAADLHLDSPLVGLRRYEGAPVAEIRSATRRAFTNLVDLCLEEQVQLVLLAGDLYDGESRDYQTALFLARELARLREIGARVAWIRGNHDAQSRLTKHLALGEHVMELGVKAAETWVLEDLGVAVHGQGFASQQVTEDLSRRYPAPLAGYFNIGLLHTALSGRPGHAPYAPCELPALVHKGYDYWALGHVHRREIVAEEPWVVFPGNLQGRHVRETGEKGASLVTVEEGRVRAVRHCPLDVVRFANETLSVQAAKSAADVVELCGRAMEQAVSAAAGRMVAMRITLVGRTPAHAELARDFERFSAEVQSRANRVSAGDLWLEDVRQQTRTSLDLAALSEREDALGEVVRALAATQHEEGGGGLAGELRAVLESLPAELRTEELGLGRLDDAELETMARGVVEGLLARILGEA